MKSGLIIGLLLFPTLVFGQLQELEAIAIENPDRAIPVFTSYPDAAVIIIKSSIPNLQFDSNLGLVADLSEPGVGEYRLIVQPMRQTITASGSGFIQLRFNVSIAYERQVVFYEVEKVVNEVPVLFRIEPTDATLYLNEREVEIQNSQQPIQIDSYNLRIEKEGYKPIVETIEVNLENTFFEFQLVRIDPVILTVTTEPTGATVLLDGVEIGQTASNGVLQLFRFPAEHELEVTMNGYLSQSKEIEINGIGENAFEFELVRNAGSLSLDVNPSDAVVELNRQPISTSVTQELVPGMYRIEISKNGYKPVVEDIQIERGIISERTYNLVAYTGRLQFSVTPNFAKTTLINANNEQVNSWIGLIILDEVKVGSYTLRVEAEGYKSSVHDIGIERDQLKPISIFLEEGSDGLVDIDGYEYQTVEIGDQIWMAENLRTTRYKNGDPINQVYDYEFDSNKGQIYGKLYKWNAVISSKGICPVGWHIPDRKEWGNLIDFLGGSQNAGRRMKQGEESEFSAYFAGFLSNGSFMGLNRDARWWVSSGNFIWGVGIKDTENSVLITSYTREYGLSVRCIED